MIVLGMTTLGSRQRAEAALRPIAEASGATVDQTAAAIFRETCRRIAEAVRTVIEETINQPVYTIHELLEGRQLKPQILCVVGGPAAAMAPELARRLECEPFVPPHAESANAIGAALARTTSELTLLADTEQGTLTIAEEGLQTEIPPHFTCEDGVRMALERLREKVRGMGAAEQDIALEVLDAQEYNMVRQSRRTGKNIRVKVQIKPGIIDALSPKEG